MIWRAGAAIGAAMIVLAAGLSACGPVYDTTYQYSPPASGEGKICANQCSQIEQLCRRNCKLEYDSCLAREREQARWDYEDYVRRQTSRKQPLDKSPDDFNLDYRCTSSSSCEATCGNDQRTCYTTCGGEVTATRVCTAFCDQK